MFLSGFARSRNSFSWSPTFNKHVRFTLFASSGSHRHTSLQNPLPEATAFILHCIHFLSILISPSHPCHSKIPPRRIPFPRPWPSFSTASTAAPAASSRWTTLSWPFCAAQCSDVQPRSAPRGDAEGPVSCMVRWFFPSETMPKRWKNLCWSGHRFGLDWETRSYIAFMTHARRWKMRITSYHSNINLLPMHWPEKIRACKFIKLSLYWKISLRTLQPWPVGKLCAALFYPAKAVIQNCLTVMGYSWSF